MKRTTALILAMILAFSLCGCGGTATSAAEEKTMVSSRDYAEGGSCIVTENGVVNFDETTEGYMTIDRNHIITLTDGTLSYSDAKMENIVEVDTDVDYVGLIKNDGFVYGDEDGEYYRVIFGAEEPLKLAELTNARVADNKSALLYSTEDSIYTLASDSDEKNKVGTFTDNVSTIAVSDDASMALWLLSDGDDEWTPVFCVNGETTKGETYTANYSSFYAYFSEDQSLMVAYSYNANYIYIVKAGEEVVKVTLPDEVNSVDCNKGEINQTKASDITSIYVTIDADSGVKLYGITLDGEKESLLSNINKAQVYNGKVVYTDEDGDLYYADVNGTSIGEETKITGDCDDFDFTDSGEYVYLTKDYDSSACTVSLYAYKLGDDKPTKIASDVYYHYYSFISYFISTDGASVYYLKDMQEVPDSYSDYGNLYCWTYSAKDPTSVKIAGDVLNGTITSFLSNGIDKTNVVFDRYNSTTEKDGETYISYDLVKWNGKETEKLCSDLIEEA